MKPYKTKLVLLVNLSIEFIIAVVYSLVILFWIDFSTSQEEVLQWVVISLILLSCLISLGMIVYNNIISLVKLCRKRNTVDTSKVVPLVEFNSENHIFTFRNYENVIPTDVDETKQHIEVRTIDTKIN